MVFRGLAILKLRRHSCTHEAGRCGASGADAEFAAAVVLAVEAELFGESEAVLEAVVPFEVGGEEAFGVEGATDGVERGRVLVGADGEGGGEAVEAAGKHGAVGAAEAVAETALAAGAFLFFALVAFCGLFEPVGVVGLVDEEGGFEAVGEEADAVEAAGVFFAGGDVGVGEEEGDVVAEVAQGGDAVCGAGGAAGVEEDSHGVSLRRGWCRIRRRSRAGG